MMALDLRGFVVAGGILYNLGRDGVDVLACIIHSSGKTYASCVFL